MTTAMGTDRSRETLRQLRESITSGRWPLNSRIPTEAELMVEFGVGRSTIREAVRSLAALGMLEPARSRGTFVRSLSPVSAVLADFVTQHAADDILAVRQMIETEATRLAAVNCTAEQLAELSASHRGDVAAADTHHVQRGDIPGNFHAIILDAAGNSLMKELYGGLMHGLRTAELVGTVKPGIDDAGRRADHLEILEAITARDPERAAQAAQRHAAHDLIRAE